MNVEQTRTNQEEIERPSICDLVELFEALSACKTLLGGYYERADSNSKPHAGYGGKAFVLKQLLQDEEERIDDRLHDIMGRIRNEPVRSYFEAMQTLRFKLFEYGACPGPAKQDLQLFLKDWAQVERKDC